MKNIRHVAGMMAAVLVIGVSALAQDSYWGSSSGDFQPYSGNWTGGVPGVGDNARFENNATYTVSFTADAACDNAFFDAPGGTVTVDAQPHEWNLSGNLNVGQDVGAAAIVELSSGTVTVDRVETPNVTTGGVGDDWIRLYAGVLNTAGADIRMATTGYGANLADFRIGNTDGIATTLMVWNMTSGTHLVYTAGPDSESGNHTHIGGSGSYASRGIVNVSGAGTVFSNAYRLFIGSAQGWGYTDHTYSNELNVTSGAKVYSRQTYIGFKGRYNRLTVDGAGSVFSAAGLACGKNGWYSEFAVTDGGRLECSGGLSIGNEGADYCRGLVSGNASTVQVAYTQMGIGGDHNQLVVTNGGSLITGNINLGKNAGVIDNEILVTGAGSELTSSGTVYMEASNGVVRVENGGYAYFNNASPGGYYGEHIARGSNSEISYHQISVRSTCTLLVETGGLAEARSSGIVVGSTSGGTGILHIAGADALVRSTNNIYMRVAGTAGGDAEVLISGGGMLQHNLGAGSWPSSIGYAAGAVGRVTVTGSGSQLYSDSTSRLAIGDYGTGYLRIKDGGLARNRSGALGYVGGSTGTVTVVGGGSVWTNTANVTLGRSDDGSTATLAFELDETGCGTVYVDGTMTIYPAQSYLTVDLSNYQWQQGTEFVLVDCGTLSTAFDAGNIFVTGLNGGTVTQDEGNNNQIILTVNGPVGTTILVK